MYLFQNKVNVVFPGGQADNHESDFQACKREVQEEINLDVEKQCEYIGQFPQNFYYAKKRGKLVYITCHLWVLKTESSFIPRLNAQELIDYRWVDIREILLQQNLTKYKQNKMGIFSRLPIPSLSKNIKQNFVSVEFPGLNVGLKRDVWGLTYNLISYMLQMIKHNLKKYKLTSEQKEVIESIDRVIVPVSPKITFRPSYMLSFPLKNVANCWYYVYRTKAFSYPPSKLSETNIFIGVFLTLIVFILIFIV